MHLAPAVRILAHAVWKGPTEIILGFGLPFNRVRHALVVASGVVPVGTATFGLKSRSPLFHLRTSQLCSVVAP